LPSEAQPFVESTLFGLRKSRRPVKEMFMSQVQDRKVAPNTGQFRCHECQKTAALQQQVHGVVHDFNNILEVIVGFSELLLIHTPDKYQLRNDIAEIRKAAGQGTALTRNLLRFYRDEALETDTLDINELLRESRHFFQQLIGDRFALQIVAGAGLYPVSMNASQAQQIVTNLLKNARDAMPEGGTLVIESGSLNLNEHHSENQIGVPAGRYTTLTVIPVEVWMQRLGLTSSNRSSQRKKVGRVPAWDWRW
jgi:signal transduction histidine kinase